MSCSIIQQVNLQIYHSVYAHSLGSAPAHKLALVDSALVVHLVGPEQASDEHR